MREIDGRSEGPSDSARLDGRLMRPVDGDAANGALRRNTSETPFVSDGVRLVLALANTTALPSSLIAGCPESRSPGAPADPLARLASTSAIGKIWVT